MKKNKIEESSQISTNKALTLSIEPASGSRRKMTATWNPELPDLALDSFDLIKHEFDQEAKNEFHHKLTENVFDQIESLSPDSEKMRKILEITESAINELLVTP